MDIFDRDKVNAAIDAIVAYCKESGMNLFEVWRACETVELSALALMGEKARELAQSVKDEDASSL